MPGLLDEMQQQPAALHELVNTIGPSLKAFEPFAARLQSGGLRRVLFTGMGSSFHAVYPALIYLIEQGIEAAAVESSELLYYHQPQIDAHTLLVLISQSGRSVEIQKLLETLKQRAPTIGVTNDPASPLARGSDAQLYLHAGEELTVSSKTYTCTLAALHVLARTLSSGSTGTALSEVGRATDAISEALPGWGKRIDEVAAQLASSRFLVFLGRGPSRASAMTGALIAKETAKLPTEGMSGGQFRHGPVEVLAPDVAAVIFASPGRTLDLNLGLAAELAQREGQVVVIGGADRPILNTVAVDIPALDEWLTPIAEIVPIQLLAARLAALRGFEVGKFRYGQKVTTVE